MTGGFGHCDNLTSGIQNTFPLLTVVYKGKYGMDGTRFHSYNDPIGSGSSPGLSDL
jgi:hypothetical protein